MLTRVHFREVCFYASKKGVCPRCGRIAVRTKKFWQTLNPFNRNADGSAKSVTEIRQALKVEADRWREKTVYHLKCEDRS